jgi:hypothetical protein
MKRELLNEADQNVAMGMTYQLPAEPLLPLIVPPTPKDELTGELRRGVPDTNIVREIAREMFGEISKAEQRVTESETLLKNYKKKTRGSTIPRAIVLCIKNPNWSDAKVAEAVPCDPSLLSRSEEYQRNARAARIAAANSAAAASHRAEFDARTSGDD